MWEHRLIWTSTPPHWWHAAWKAAIESLAHHGRTPEDRPDTYLLLGDRPDAGLKLRGTEGEFEIKVRHDARDGWELWEKTPFFSWSDLEAARLAALLRHRCAADRIDAGATAVAGAKALLESNGIAWKEIRVAKTRMQARAGDLLPGFSSSGVDPDWIAELVHLDAGGAMARSICFETMTPGTVAVPEARGRALGYPEFLIGVARG